MEDSRQEVFSELAKLRALPPLGDHTYEVYENVNILFEEIRKFRDHMNAYRREPMESTMTELHVLVSITRTIIAEVSKVSGLISVETLKGWRLMIMDWRNMIQCYGNRYLYPEMRLGPGTCFSTPPYRMRMSFRYFRRCGIEALRERMDLYQLTDIELKYLHMEHEVEQSLDHGESIIYFVDIEELETAELRPNYEHQLPIIDQAIERAQEIITEYSGWKRYHPGKIEDWDIRLEALEEFKVNVVQRFARDGSCNKNKNFPLALVSVFQKSSNKSILEVVAEFEASTPLIGSNDGKSAMFIDHCLEPDDRAQFAQYRQLPFKSTKVAVISRFGGIATLVHKELTTAMKNADDCST